MRNRLSSYAPGILLFVVFLVIGLRVYKDYGMAWDERTQRNIGYLSYNYIFENDKAIERSTDRDYGVGFELPLIFIEKAMHLEDIHDIFLMRHLVTHIFFLISALCFYILIFRLTRNPLIACAGFLMLVLTPRFYAHSFFNTKDLPLLSMFIISFLATQIAFEKKKVAWYLLMGIAWGYTTSIRVSAIIPVLCVITFMLIDAGSSIRNKERMQPVIASLLLFFIGYFGFTILCWPRLWPSPVHNFIQAYQVFSRYGWGGVVRFDGYIRVAPELPWYYASRYMFITIPEIAFIAGIVGLIWLAYEFLRKPGSFLRNALQRNYLLYAACFLGPLAAVIVLHSTLYDDWRHLYFTYPSFVLMMIFALHKLVQTKWRIVAWGLCALQLVLAATLVIKNHPYQQVYFNYFVSHDREYLRKHYEMDYWAVAYKQGLEFILDHDSSDQIRLHVTTMEMPLFNNVLMLHPDKRKRILVVGEADNPKYYITNFRTWSEEPPFPVIYHDIEVHRSAIVRIYKLRD